MNRYLFPCFLFLCFPFAADSERRLPLGSWDLTILSSTDFDYEDQRPPAQKLPRNVTVLDSLPTGRTAGEAQCLAIRSCHP